MSLGKFGTRLWKTPSLLSADTTWKGPTAFRLYRHRTFATESYSERKLPDTQEAVRLKPWQRNFLVGVSVGAVYFATYRYYNEKKQKDSFLSYRLASKEPVSSTANIFCLEPQDDFQDFDVYRDAWRRGIWNVHFKQPQLQIVRAYTPLPPEDSESVGREKQLRFLIRRDKHGEVSSYLHSLPIGSRIELRGPNLEYELTRDIKQVVFFAGGTGITPALQTAHAMFADGNKAGRTLHILWASRRREDCIGGYSDAPPDEPMPPKPRWSGFFTNPRVKHPVPFMGERGVIVKILENLKAKYPGQITVEYFVNEEDTWIDRDAVFKALSRFEDKDFSLGSASPQEQRQILICGPSGFINYLAGPKEWSGGREQQGPLRKIIAHAISMNPHNVKVWKI